MFDNNNSANLGFGAMFGLVIALFVVYLAYTYVVTPLIHPPPFVPPPPPPNTIVVNGHISPGWFATHTIYEVSFSHVGNATFSNDNYTISVPNNAIYNITEYYEYNHIYGLIKGNGSCIYDQPFKADAVAGQSEVYFNITAC
jgi:hypothetical protein